MPASEYVTFDANGFWRISGTRVSLASVVLQFREGASPEAIVRDFPTLALDQVYGAIAFYLRNHAAVDESLERLAALERELSRDCAEKNRELRETILARSRSAECGSTLP